MSNRDVAIGVLVLLVGLVALCISMAAQAYLYAFVMAGLLLAGATMLKHRSYERYE